MKKVLMLALSVGLVFGAHAQRGGHGGFHGGGGYYYRPHFGFGLGFYSPFYPYYGLYGPMYYGFGYPPYYRNDYMPAELAFKIEDVKNDYKARIKDVRHNKSLTHKEKRQQIHDLKKGREGAILQTKRDFYYSSRRSRSHNNYNNNNSNGNNSNGNNSNGNNSNGNNSNGNNSNGNSSNGNSGNSSNDNSSNENGRQQ